MAPPENPKLSVRRDFTRTDSYASLQNMILVLPHTQIPDPEVFRTAEALLERHGCVTRRRGEQGLEVWEANLSEHYLLTFDAQQPSTIDFMQLDGV